MLTTDSQPLVGIKQLSSKRSPKFFYIDWWLMNHCSWDCSYCHDIIKSGNIDLPRYQDCIKFIDEAVLFSKKQNKICHLHFTGGEVTEWSDFVDLIEYAKNAGCYVKFRSNASTSRDIWERLLENSDEISMEVHPEYTSTAHFLSLLDLSVKSKTFITVQINMLKEQWTEMEDLYNKIKQKYPNLFLFKKMLFQDPVFNTKPLNYEKSQKDVLKQQYKDLVFVDRETIEETNYQSLLLDDKNKFKEWKCYAGIEQIVVDAWGKVYRGHCRFNGYLGSISDRVVWMDEPAVCGVDYCKNSFDIQATKKLLE